MVLCRASGSRSHPEIVYEAQMGTRPNRIEGSEIPGPDHPTRRRPPATAIVGTSKGCHLSGDYRESRAGLDREAATTKGVWKSEG